MASYSVLTGFNKATRQHEVIFGDYAHETVLDEREFEAHNLELDYTRLRVARLASDEQELIDLYVAGLPTPALQNS